MQIFMKEDYGPLLKGKIYQPLRIGYFEPDTKILSALIPYQESFYLITEYIFDIKIRKPQRSQPK